MSEKSYEGWALVELMGHRRIAGRISEVEIAGAAMLRIDVPEGQCSDDGALTQFYSAAAIYSITPMAEAPARALAEKLYTPPAHRWELPASVGGEDGDDGGELLGRDGMPF